MPRLSAFEHHPSLTITSLAIETPENASKMSFMEVATPELIDKIVEAVEFYGDNLEFYLEANSVFSLISQMTGYAPPLRQRAFSEIADFIREYSLHVPADHDSVIKYMANARQIYGADLESIGGVVYDKVFSKGAFQNDVFRGGGALVDEEITALFYFYCTYPNYLASLALSPGLIDRVIKRAYKAEGSLRLEQLAFARILNPELKVDEKEIRKYVDFFRSFVHMQSNPQQFLGELKDLAILMAEQVQVTEDGICLTPPSARDSAESSERVSNPPLQRSF